MAKPKKTATETTAVTVKILHLKCLRCGKEWAPRKPEVVVCPKCHSPYWNKETGRKKQDPPDEE
ncbi:MAG TPA: hypothetical protein DCZ04_16680 [Syntrophorhabdus aromaticivorans]|nr:hypothetical protein [Syntrophorhabdus aromaticivorans]